MLVHKPTKKLLLNLREPDAIAALIPGAKVVNIKGHDIVSVPHDLDTVRVLRNMGIKAPSPMLSYYEWAGRYTPFTHQRETSEFLTLNPRSFVLNDMGTGKTNSALWSYDYLRKAGIVDWCLVVSPLSTLERVWADEVFRHFSDMSYGVVHGTAERRIEVAKDKYDIYIINHDGLKIQRVTDVFQNKPGVGLVIVDEVAVFRNSSTQRWKALNALINGSVKLGRKPMDWVWALTGTPIPNEPTDAFAQLKLVTPGGNYPKYFGAFRDAVMRQISPFKWVARKDALDTVYRNMQPGIRFKREDCIDLPPTTYATREVELTSEQKKLYKAMMDNFKAEFAGGQITASNEAIKLGRLVQIGLGVTYDAQGEDIIIPSKPRTDVVLEIIEEAGAKVIVFSPYIGALKATADEVGKHHTVSVVYGGVSKKQRDDIFYDFMQPGGSRVLVAHPACMAHGLTLTSADTIVWLAPHTSSETVLQANARIARPGQKMKTLIVTLVGSEVERRIHERQVKRESSQGVLLTMFE